MVIQVNGNRCFGELVGEAPPVEVIHQHVTRRRIAPGVWPVRLDVRLLPTSRRVTVETPDGVVMAAIVRMWVADGYVYASARPNDQVWGEDLNAGGAFPRECELLAERLALESL